MSWQKKDKDIDEGGIPFHLDKSAVLQEARIFNATPIMPRKCRILLAKIIYLLYQGETLGTVEATELFFSITKLFQNKDMSLRQMVYLVIKELSTISEDVIMVTSSLMRDMQPKSDVIYRGNAIRALCKITDVSMLPGIERFLKAAIVEKNAAISSASLMSSYHLFWQAKDLIRRWGNEVQEALNSKGGSSSGGFFSGSASSSPAAVAAAAASHSTMVQYHAMGLMYAIRQHDRMAVAKLVQGFTSGNSGGSRGFFGGSSGSVIRNNMAHCLLIRYACQVMENDVSVDRQLYDLLEGWIRHRSDMVSLEAIRSLCALPGITDKDLASSVAALQLFLASPKSTIRFAAIRTLNQLAAAHPQAVGACNIDMEGLITDSNRSVATFAITTLLKTGNEASVDRLIKQIAGFMSEISNEFKVIVMEAIRSLALKFPSKHPTMLTFLSNVLRDEGSYECKKAVVDAMLDMVREIPDCKEVALSHLCEFIEDCEFHKLSVRVLHLLGEEGPTTVTPSIYIRHIYNRVILEKSVVRAAAVNALTKFAVNVNDPALQGSIRILLRRCLEDRDDEVRDRATWALRVCDNAQASEKYIKDTSSYDWETLEGKLYQYCADPQAAQAGPFNVAQVPRVSKTYAEAMRQRTRALGSELENATPLLPAPGTTGKDGSGAMGRDGTKKSSGGVGGHPASTEDSASAAFKRQELYAQELKAIPEFSGFGPLLVSSSKPCELTEAETEYVVQGVKHLFRGHVVFQFDCTNTIPDQLLENAFVIMAGMEDDLEEVATVPAPALACNQTSATYVAFAKLGLDEGADESAALQPIVGSYNTTLKFMVKDCDPNTGEPDSDEGFEDEYVLEDVELTLADWMQPRYLGEPLKVWAELEGAAERVETFALSAFVNLQDALDSVAELMGMYPCDNTHRVPAKKVSHTAIFTALYAGQIKTILRVRLTMAPHQGGGAS
ncbi:coatomer gamma subunit [Dimargaris cristalligena]|uniref:Coatomer subunit gamma n=1 Tax=Dimargaris cristalligena TaxID=215637 RepID=A0A4P9ZUV3_9FUNG|nr:coatomer gamma subunit [Dimargaris cristalligena]|eukprot:RKP36380.1 coatomer gamma subunit [Dimargaris cristalligena]